MNLLDSPSCATIKRWEQAGVSLFTALRDYMELCIDLGTNSLREGAEPKDLVSRIDSTLAAAHTTMSHNLNKSITVLARTRNKLASPLADFPEEILSEIFMNVVYDHTADTPKRLTMKQEVRLIYRHLYNLLNVCSSWRDVVMTRGALWSVIPVFSTPSAPKFFQLGLERAGGSPLHLAADTSFANKPIDLAVLLAEHGPRFRTINISTNDKGELDDAINKILQYNTPGSLSELSIRLTEMGDGAERLPRRLDYIITRDSPHQASFASLVRDLVAFRISGAQFHWDTLPFSTRLVELRVQGVTLGYDGAIVTLLQALTSASNLRDLEIISIITVRDFTTRTQHSVSPSPITFPSIQSLFIEDLYLNTLERLLPMIAPGSYHFTLFLSPNSLDTKILVDDPAEVTAEDFDEVDVLCRALRHTSVDTLMIGGELEGDWLTVSELANILKATAVLKTLKLHNWTFNQDICSGLTRVGEAQTSAEDHPFPVLQNLHLTLATIHDDKSFLDMITSRSLRGIILGGKYWVDQPAGWKPLQEDSSIVQWLRWNALHPDFRLVEEDYCPPEFHSKEWKLW